jgi:dTDP-4-amino-4,6-dideoxygalactose transaminase
MARLTAPVDWTRSAMLGEIHAAVALDQVRHLKRIQSRRDAVAAIYADLAASSSLVIPQRVAAGDRHSWVHWTAAFDVDDVSLLGKELDALGVQTKPYYSPALHQVGWGHRTVSSRELPVTESLVDRVLALPMSSEMTTADADAVLWRVLGALG